MTLYLADSNVNDLKDTERQWFETVMEGYTHELSHDDDSIQGGLDDEGDNEQQQHPKIQNGSIIANCTIQKVTAFFETSVLLGSGSSNRRRRMAKTSSNDNENNDANHDDNSKKTTTSGLDLNFSMEYKSKYYNVSNHTRNFAIFISNNNARVQTDLNNYDHDNNTNGSPMMPQVVGVDKLKILVTPSPTTQTPTTLSPTKIPTIEPTIPSTSQSPSILNTTTLRPTISPSPPSSMEVTRIVVIAASSSGGALIIILAICFTYKQLKCFTNDNAEEGHLKDGDSRLDRNDSLGGFPSLTDSHVQGHNNNNYKDHMGDEDEIYCLDPDDPFNPINQNVIFDHLRHPNHNPNHGFNDAEEEERRVGGGGGGNDSIVSGESLLSIGSSLNTTATSHVEADETQNLADEFDAYKDKNVEKMRSQVQSSLTDFDDMMCQALTKALMDEYDVDDVDEQEQDIHYDVDDLTWGCRQSGDSTEIEASVLCHVNDWMKRMEKEASLEERRIFMQQVLNKIVASVKHQILTPQDGSRIVHESAALLGLQLAADIPEPTLIVSGMRKQVGRRELMEAFREFGEIRDVAVSPHSRGFGLIRFKTPQTSVARAMDCFRTKEIVVQDVAVMIRLLKSDPIKSNSLPPRVIDSTKNSKDIDRKKHHSS